MSKTKSEVKKIRKKISYTSKHERESKNQPSFTKEDALLIARALKIDFAKEKFDLDEFTAGVNVELEHGTKCPECNVTKNDPILTGKNSFSAFEGVPGLLHKVKEVGGRSYKILEWKCLVNFHDFRGITSRDKISWEKLLDEFDNIRQLPSE